MYVGITRAQRSLRITWCERRKSGKESLPRDISRFIEEMGGDVKVRGKNDAPVSREQGRANAANLKAMFGGMSRDQGRSG